MSLQNGMANIAGIVGQIIIGVTIDWTGGYITAFPLSAAIMVAGIVAWTAMIPTVAPIAWRAGDLPRNLQAVRR